MAKDKANIFKLKDLEEYDEDPFFDCMPGAKEFAYGLSKIILTKETPFVLLLESNFGMGKTHFVTRFTQYLRKEKIDTIYFSAWENDYLAEPFLSFSKEILKYFNKVSLVIKTQTFFTTAIDSMKKLALNLTKSTSFSVGIQPFGVGAEVDIDNDKALKAVEDLFTDFKKEKDAVQEFKEDMAKFINRLPEKRLVLIVDELDRCRPDYAMKTLEIIKHFFDIEGFFVIVPTNENSLNKCVMSLYGIEENEESEHYFNKFFSDKADLYQPDYLKMVKDYVNEEKLSAVLTSGKLVLDKGKYNSIVTLIYKLAKFGEEKKLTIREMTKACDKAIYLCKLIKYNIYCEYLVFLICQKLSRQEKNNCSLSRENPFNERGQKSEILTFKLSPAIMHGSFSNIGDYFCACFPIFKEHTFSSYKDIENHLAEIKEGFEKGLSFQDSKYRQPYYSDFDQIKKRIPAYIDEKFLQIQEYKKNWDSSDNDNAVKSYYMDIVNSEYKIHTEM